MATTVSIGRAGGSLQSVVFADARKGPAVGNDGRFLQATDGGRTWRTLQAGVYRPGWLIAEDALDAHRAWVAGALGAILHSATSGRRSR